MIQVSDAEWSASEKELARKVFDTAYEREVSVLIKDAREKAGAMTTLDDVWQLHDFLSARRHQLDGKYDYRYSMLIFVFAQLVKEGWLQIEELEGLAGDKLTKIAALTRM